MATDLFVLIRWAKPYGRSLVFGLCCVAVGSGLTLLLPVYLGEAAASFPAISSRVWLALVSVFVARAGLEFTGNWCLNRSSSHAINDLREALYARFLRASLSFHDRGWSADLVSVLTADAAFVLDLLKSLLPNLARNLPVVLGALILLFVENWRLAEWVSVAALPLFVLAFVTGRALRRLTRKMQAKVGQMAIAAQDSFRGLRVVKALAQEDFFIRRFAQLNSQLFKLRNTRIVWDAAREAFLPLAMAGMSVWCLWVARQQLQTGEASFESLVTFFAYLAVLGAGLLGLVHAYAGIESLAGAAQRISELQAAAVEENLYRGNGSAITLPCRAKGALELENVTFCYQRGGRGIFDVSLGIQPGEVVAIVGPNGAGKSTLVHLLLRFYDPQQGSIRLDGLAAEQCPLASWRKNFALVTRDPAIFDASLADNIALASPTAPAAEIEQAVQAVGLHHFFTTLPEGYASRVGENGIRLSSGQRQRLALARVFLLDPAVIILDEALTSIDRESEQAFTEAFQEWAGRRTVILISQQNERVAPVSRIVRMEAGRIIADSSKA
ncbi:MAG: ABC transporter ATP-binding protein [Acidobacteria bacterium]|nr:ABC transporter ATP-binding protein [Acidobacteriota bacterium]